MVPLWSTRLHKWTLASSLDQLGWCWLPLAYHHCPTDRQWRRPENIRSRLWLKHDNLRVTISVSGTPVFLARPHWSPLAPTPLALTLGSDWLPLPPPSLCHLQPCWYLPGQWGHPENKLICVPLSKKIYLISMHMWTHLRTKGGQGKILLGKASIELYFGDIKDRHWDPH